ncbi:MAG: biotin/lipoyl-binding protein [Bacteroidales bacterium]
MKKFFKILILVIILGAFVFTIYFLYNKSQAKPVVFETTTPTVTNIVKKTVATGKVVPRKEIEIKPKVSGIIEDLYVEEGRIIHKGDLIAKVRIIPDMVSLNNAESRLNRAKIALENAEINYNRQNYSTKM